MTKHANAQDVNYIIPRDEYLVLGGLRHLELGNGTWAVSAQKNGNIRKDLARGLCSLAVYESHNRLYGIHFTSGGDYYIAANLDRA
jgi:hypothetical protein